MAATNAASAAMRTLRKTRRAALRTAAAEACAVARPPARLAAAPGSAVAHLLRACLARDAGVDGAVAVVLAAGDFESTKVLSDATLAGLGEPTLDGHTGPARTIVVELRGRKGKKRLFFKQRFCF